MRKQFVPKDNLEYQMRLRGFPLDPQKYKKYKETSEKMRQKQQERREKNKFGAKQLTIN